MLTDPATAEALLADIRRLYHELSAASRAQQPALEATIRGYVDRFNVASSAPPAMPKLLEVSHVAHRLSASEEFVRRLIREKKLPAIRLGTRWRVDPRDLEAFVDAQRVANVHGNGHGA